MKVSDKPAVHLRHPLPTTLRRVLGTLAILLLLAGLAAGYRTNLSGVTLVVDGSVRQLHTHQQSVGALLLDAGLELYPEDIVVPCQDGAAPPVSEGCNAPLEPGMTVRVVRARPVLVEADGQTSLLRTHATTVDQILAEAGVTIAPTDRVTIQSSPEGSDAIPCIRVERAIPITIHEDGREVALTTTATTVGAALREAGLTLYLADRVEPGLAQPLSAGMHIWVERSRPVTIHADGRTIRTRTHRDKVRHVLADLGLVLTGQDYTTPTLDAPIEGDTTVNVIRVTERFLIQQEPIPFEVVWQADPELELDQQRLIQDGEPGVLERRFRLRYENGHEVSRTLENVYVAVPPTTKIYGYGTRIVIRQLETPQGTVEYWRTIRMLATSYSASTAGTSPSSPWYGHTRLGLPMRYGIVAVDPRFISLGSQVYVPGYGTGLAGDTGGAIQGRRIDLGYDDDNLVLWYRWVDVYLLTPVPEQINYILGY